MRVSTDDLHHLPGLSGLPDATLHRWPDRLLTHRANFPEVTAGSRDQIGMPRTAAFLFGQRLPRAARRAWAVAIPRDRLAFINSRCDYASEPICVPQAGHGMPDVNSQPLRTDEASGRMSARCGSIVGMVSSANWVDRYRAGQRDHV
jgi:hypothetical protein